MSLDIKVFVERDKMPPASDWQKQISAAGFPLTLHQGFDVTEFSGWLPCKMNGKDVGFEYYFDVLEDTMFDTSDPEVKSHIGERDVCVGFSITGANENIAAAAIAGGVLAKHCNGVLWVSDAFVQGVDPIAWAKDSVAEFTK